VTIQTFHQFIDYRQIKFPLLLFASFALTNRYSFITFDIKNIWYRYCSCLRENPSNLAC